MVCSELHTKIGKREEAVRIVEPLLIGRFMWLPDMRAMWTQMSQRRSHIFRIERIDYED